MRPNEQEVSSSCIRYVNAFCRCLYSISLLRILYRIKQASHFFMHRYGNTVQATFVLGSNPRFVPGLFASLRHTSVQQDRSARFIYTATLF